MLDRHLISYIRGFASAELSQQIECWLNDSIENQKAFDKIVNILKSVDQLTEYKRLDPDEAWKKIDLTTDSDEQ